MGIGSGIEERRLGRRSFVRGTAAGGIGLAAAALIGCGDDAEDEEAAPAEPTGAGTGGGDTSAATGQGELIEGEGLPYPLNFPEPGTEPKRGGEMRVGTTWDVGPLDPTVSAAGGTIVIPNFVYNRLLGHRGGPDVNLDQVELEPELAAEWERSEDGLVFTFNLRDDVKWQNLPPLDGRPFVAEDVKFAYERYATDGVHTSYWTNVNSIDAVDDHTLTITLNEPTADFILPLGSRYQTIFPRELVESGAIEREAVGTGPMILKEAVAADHVTWERNPEYWERDVLLDGVTFRMMPDSNSRLAAFRAGQIDYGYSIVTSISDVENLLGTNPDIQINMTRSVYGGIPFAMDLSDPMFQDERVRRAMSLAMDRDLMAQVIWEGLAYLYPAMPWPAVSDEEPTAENGLMGDWVRYDPEEARQLLSAAGAEDLSFTNRYFAYGDYLHRISEILVDQFRQVGITMDGGSVDYTEFNSMWVPRDLRGVTTSGWLTVGFDWDNFFYNQIHSESAGNRHKVSDPQVDEWSEQQRFQLDPAERRETLRKIWDRMLDQMYRPPLPSGYSFEIYQPWLHGIRFGGSVGNNSSYYDWGDQVAEAWVDK